MNTNLSGAPDCPCLNPESIPHFDQIHELLARNSSLQWDTDFINPVPFDYGLSCDHHDLRTRKSCEDPDLHKIPDYCYMDWCYVDVDKCFRSNQTFFEDEIMRGFYYSYSTCSGPTSFERRSNTLHGAYMTVVLPEYVFPYSFEKEANNSYPVFEYTDFQGAIIEYLDAIRIECSINSLSYKIRSRGARRRKPNSNYTAAVSDVGEGIVDMGGGVFWVTAERLELAPFAVPLISSHLYLFELKRESDVFVSIKNTLKPFTGSLWLVLVMCLIVAGIARGFSSDSTSFSESYESLYGRRRESSSKFQRASGDLLVYLSTINKVFVEYFATSSETEEMSTFPQKILVFGLGFFILVLGSTYTANLATFLTVKNFGVYVQSIDKAIESNLKICAQVGVQELIETQYPDLKSYNKIVYMPFSELKYISEASNFLKIGKCDVMVGDELDLMFIKEEDQEEFCKNELVSIKAPVMTLYQTFPVQQNFQADLSKAMLDLREQGIDFAEILSRYASPLSCEVYFETETLSNAQIEISHMFFPLGILAFCIVIGTIFKIREIITKLRAGKLKRENDEDIDNNIL